MGVTFIVFVPVCEDTYGTAETLYKELSLTYVVPLSTYFANEDVA